LEGLHEAWVTRRTEVEDRGSFIAQNIQRMQQGTAESDGSPGLTRELVERAVQYLEAQYDGDLGGFGGAPKFPPSQDLELLMAEYERTGEERLLRMATHTLDMMGRGGMHDHLAGGFHRYSTDSRWHVPHFEKMLYNQAQLSKVYLQAYLLTGDDRHRHTAEGILRFVSHTMTSPDGAFYSALDAETDGIEGKYYLWTEEEVREVLGDDAPLFRSVYALASMPEGNGGAIYMRRSLQESADSLGMSETALRQRLGPVTEALLKIRRGRPHPLLDGKVITAWNGLMIDAYSYAYEVLKEDTYLQASQRAAGFTLARLTDGKAGLRRTYREGVAKYDGYQEDYAFLARGLLGLYRASGERRYLDRAVELADRMIERFWDEQDGGFYLTDPKADLIVRTKSPYDKAVPSGNSVAAHILLSLGKETGRTEYIEKARQTMAAFAGAATESPGAFKYMALAIHRYLEQVGGVADLASRFPAGVEGDIGDVSAGSIPRRDDLVRAEAFVSVDRLIPAEAFQVAVRLAIAAGHRRSLARECQPGLGGVPGANHAGLGLGSECAGGIRRLSTGRGPRSGIRRPARVGLHG
jgi:uncharacterized protein YyaL (SSP411 family)